MIWLQRAGIVAAWTAAIIVTLFLLIFLFVFGDCMETDRACMTFKEGAARFIPVIVSGVYGLGLGVMLQRWIFDRKH